MTRADLDVALAGYAPTPEGHARLLRAATLLGGHVRGYVRVYLGVTGLLYDTMQRLHLGACPPASVATVASVVDALSFSADYRGSRILARAEWCALDTLVQLARVQLARVEGDDALAREALYSAIQMLGTAAYYDALARGVSCTGAELARTTERAGALAALRDLTTTPEAP